MGTVWNRRIRPTVAFCSFILLLFVLHARESSIKRTNVTDSLMPTHVEPNLRQKIVQIQRKQLDNNHDNLRASRNILATDEDRLCWEEEAMSDLQASKQDSLSEAYKETESNEFRGNESLSALGFVDEDKPCANARQHMGYPDSCSFVKAIPQCSSGTLIEYTQFYYCLCARSPILAYIALGLWLASLFYMLGNTAADFFCSAIQKLSTLLHLPPTVAGVTLLPLGNGAPDVFASVAAFVGGSGQGQVGLNSVLGGATFVSSVVAGSVSLLVASSSDPVELDQRCFLRDVGFFLVTLATLTLILFVGKIHFWGAIGYISIYALYAVTIAVVEFLRSQRNTLTHWHPLEPLIPGQSNERSNHSSWNGDESRFDNQGPYLEIVDSQGRVASAVGTSLPQWIWARHVAFYSHQTRLDMRNSGGTHRPLWGWSEEEVGRVKRYSGWGLCSYCLGWPLTIPRRLTIPLMDDVGWSRPYTICSATFAPTLLAMVWDGKDNGPFGSAWKEYIFAGSCGIVLGGLSFLFLKSDRPPRRYLFPWVAGGFVMSIVWFYIIANELVAALVAIGVVLEIDAAILGLTVLAWGNSIGDLMSNTALVYHGGDGIQIAFSGCYAGPMFNTLMGIGISFVLASWKTYPQSFDIPQDDSIFITLAFLVAGLIFALCMLPSQKMQPSKPLGVGLVILYISFLVVRLVHAIGLNSLTMVGDN